MNDTYKPIEPDGHNDEQLLPVTGGRYQTIFHGPPGTDVGDLHCDLEPVGDPEHERVLIVNHSGWMPSDEHRAMLEAGAHVRLSVWMHPIPPLAMSVEPPVCSCHGEAMAWDGDDEAFFCRRISNIEATNLNETSSQPGQTSTNEENALDSAREDFKPQPPEVQ